jgi:hypothetical protein
LLSVGGAGGEEPKSEIFFNKVSKKQKIIAILDNGNTGL